MKKFKPTLSYDECDIVNAEVEYYLKEDNPDNLSKEEIEKLVWEGDCLINAWENFKECLNEDIQTINKNDFFKARGQNMGWRNLEGDKIFKATNSEEFLEAILPKTNEFTLRLKCMKTQIILKCYHHDSPMGETYYIKPLNKKELIKYLGDEY